MNQSGSFVAFITILLLTACSTESTSYYPFDVVNNWYYNGKQVSRIADESIKYVVSNFGSTRIQEAEVRVQRTLSGNEHYFGEDVDGVFQIGYLPQGKEKPVLFDNKRYVFRFPLNTGTSWEDTLSTLTLRSGGPRGVIIREDVPVTATLTSIDDKIEVPAGIFRNCLRVEKTGEKLIQDGEYQYIPELMISLKETNWYAPGVGLVKTSRVEETDHKLLGRGEWELELARIDSK